MILQACTWCTGQQPDRPELAEPAETRIVVACPECGDRLELTLCVLHGVEFHAFDHEQTLHCSVCHGHPTHRCVKVTLVEETAL